MAEKFKLDDHGNCPSCGNLSAQSEHVICFLCKHLYHAICKQATPEEKFATKTMVTAFLLTSTKNNFKFFCDSCATSLEVSAADSNNQRINHLETKMSSINGQLKDIMAMMKSSAEKENALPPATKQIKPASKSSIWNDPVRMATVKAPSPSAALVIPSNPDQQIQRENKSVIEKAILENHIPLKETFTNHAGELVLVCESTEKRDELKHLVHSAKEDIKMNTPKVKKKSITIVGLTREYNEEEIKQLIVQNNLIKKFVELNDINDHLQVHSIKPLRNNQERFQVFATVSQVLREGMSKSNDKLLMGINSCKVYDRNQVKRCYSCQKFGHFAANCPTPRTPSCGKCSGDHATKDCTTKSRGCINCKRENLEHTSHSASFYKCPSLLKFEDLQRSHNVDLNLRRPVENFRW